MEDQEVSSENSDSTPAVEESVSQTESEGAETQVSAPEKPKDEPQVPFHEHPRFKELIEDRRASKEAEKMYKEQLDQTRGYLEAMQKEMQALRTPKPQQGEPKYKPLIDHLKTLNPEFAQFQEDMLSKLELANERAGKAEEVQRRLEAYEQREFQTQAIGKLQSLMEQNKVPEPMRKRYDREVRSLAYEEEIQGKKLSLKDVERLFQSVHEEYTPFIESIKRESLKGYVKDKKSDSAPTGTTGGAAVVSGKKRIKAGDDQSMVKFLADGLRAAKKI